MNAHGPPTVLVVDDDVVSRMVLMHLVDSCGQFEILEAEDGQQAWEQLAQGLRPAILFCDLRMPRLSGMELLARVRAERAFDGMPFVLASAAGERATIDQAGALGAAGYLVKPFEAGQVRAHLDALAGAALAAEAPQATMQRLGIDADRLLAYLGGLQGQLGQAAGAPAAGDIERLRAGCATLGLAGAAAQLGALAADAPAAPALAAALRAVMQQRERLLEWQKSA